MTLIRAHFFESPSTRYQGAPGWSVNSSMSSIAALYCLRFSRLRQSSSVSFHDFSGSLSRALNRLSCSLLERWMKNLTRIVPSDTSMRSKSLISP